MTRKDWLVEKLFRPFRIFDRSGELYLTRYRVFRTGPIGIYLHHIVQSDEDRDFHDHPWDFWTMVVRGPGYIEHRPGGVVQWHEPWTLWSRKAEEIHRIELQTNSETRRPRDVWTLFIRFRRRRKWGFIKYKGNASIWIGHDEYMADPLRGAKPEILERYP